MLLRDNFIIKVSKSLFKYKIHNFRFNSLSESGKQLLLQFSRTEDESARLSLILTVN